MPDTQLANSRKKATWLSAWSDIMSNEKWLGAAVNCPSQAQKRKPSMQHNTIPSEKVTQ